MTFLDIIIQLLVAGLIGSIARSLVGFDKGGCVLSIVVGFIGAFLGSWMARELHFPDYLTFVIRGIEYHVMWALIGAIVFVAVLSIIAPKKGK